MACNGASILFFIKPSGRRQRAIWTWDTLLQGTISKKIFFFKFKTLAEKITWVSYLTQNSFCYN